jgi:DNA invertase Pin-like site-specific DNA recombinase
VLVALDGLAEFERDLIRTRTREGRDRAKARGLKIGRKPKMMPHRIAEAPAPSRPGRTDARYRKTV